MPIVNFAPKIDNKKIDDGQAKFFFAARPRLMKGFWSQIDQRITSPNPTQPINSKVTLVPCSHTAFAAMCCYFEKEKEMRWRNIRKILSS